MVSYTTVEYYMDSYLMGRTAAIDAAIFPAYALKATKKIKQYTLDNVDETVAFIDELQTCCCEVAELIWKSEMNDHSGKSSEKVGTYSVSYDSPEVKQAELDRNIRNSVYTWLGMTGLLYRGCN